MKIISRVFLGLVAFLLIATAAMVIWGSTPAAPMPDALAALQSDAQVTVTTDRWLDFVPASGPAETGLIFYPGGRVDYRSYAPLAHELAAAGYRVIIPAMPLNLAVFSPGKAADIIQAVPEVKHWAVGGHSLGGSMAANFAKNNPELVAGLVFLASYPAESDDLSVSNLPVLSISGSLDGLSTPEKIEASRALLPAGTVWVVVQGGNHAQFGWYGVQAGDSQATISRTSQQEQVVAALVEFLKGLK
jgi:pimeloyl-ACP methyl ester carboxylesterase